jgi:hypothetical protein
MERVTMDSGLKASLMALEGSHLRQGIISKVIGLKTNLQALGRFKQLKVSTKAKLMMVQRMDKVFSNMLQEIYLMENGTMIKGLEVNSIGQMGINTQGHSI